MMLRTFVFLLTFLMLPGMCAAVEKKPNILLIIADDLGWRDLGCTGSKDVKSPNIDKLASQGMRLNGMFTPAATCSPTRHALLTGLYPVRSGAYPNHTMVDRTTQSVFHYLKNLGYEVALHGKEHIKPKISFPYEFLGNADNGNVTIAANYITKHIGGKPWFLVVGSHEPHGPWNLGPKYDPKTITVPPYLPDHPATRSTLAKYFGEISDLDRQVGELLQALDDSKQADNTLVLFVSEQGNGMPHGGKFSLYDTGIRTATFARWPGTIKPASSSNALMQYVDVPPTLVTLAGGDATKINTGCKDANGKTGFDGRDFSGILLGKSETLRDYVFAQHTTVGMIEYKEAYPIRAARDLRYKYIRNLAPENRLEVSSNKGEIVNSWKADAKGNPALTARIEWLYKRPAEELYDLQTDENEMKNLADDLKYADIKKRLSEELDSWMKQQGDRGLETEMKALSRQPKNARSKD